VYEQKIKIIKSVRMLVNGDLGSDTSSVF
jgi:hypothetical protein